MDKRIIDLAKNLIHHSLTLKKDEKVLIVSRGTQAMPLVKALIKESYATEALPFVQLRTSSLDRELWLNTDEEHLKMMTEFDKPLFEKMDAILVVRSNPNDCETYDVAENKLKLQGMLYGDPIFGDITLKKKWCLVDFPTNSMAQLMNTSLESFEDFYFNVCNLDYGKMSKAMDSLVELMSKTDKVHILGNGTDLSFSIKGLPVIKCAGENNVPDGEVFTAPVKDSVNGHIRYNTPSPFRGYCYEDVYLEFKDGKIIKATANDTERINKIFDTDEGSRYVGEFAIGVNPYVTKPMKNTLYDEKIKGSFHFTPGMAYDDADNGNRSSVHWDLVCIQTENWGGGEIYFDDVLIRKDGIFVLESLKCLNSENLI